MLCVVSYVNMCEYLIELEEFNSEFKDQLLELCDDKVKNVRISISLIMQKNKENEKVKEIIEKLRNDKNEYIRSQFI